MQVDINEKLEKNIGAYFDYIDTDEEREIRDSDRESFLSSGDTFGLSLKASYNELSSDLGWSIMNVKYFSLCKLPVNNPINDQEYAGLLGGTFGWPPGKCIEDETGNAFYLLMLTYEESQEDNERLLVGTKILEGTHYMKLPNGSAMFIVSIDTPSLEPFPFDADERDFEHSYTGDGIANGYGFRHPGFKPGSLYVISDDHLAFVWHETKDVFTLQRLALEEILKKGLGLCVPPLPPTNNFTFMDKSYTNVFTESSICSSSSDSE